MVAAQKLFQLVVGLLIAGSVSAQQTWPTPELEQMYQHAKGYEATGDFNDAIIIYRQAIVLAPAMTLLYRDLAASLNAIQKYQEAADALSSISKMTNVDDTCYKILADSKAGLRDYKGAKQAIRNGLSRFPISGLLYNEEGTTQMEQHRPEAALDAWLKGIEKDPHCSINYKAAAELYLQSDKVAWGLIYGEIYLDMVNDTAGAQALKALLFNSYKTFFKRLGSNVPEYGKATTAENEDFIKSVNSLYAQLAAVVSDGVTTETLTMARTRFVMEWAGKLNEKYPFGLFNYWQTLIKTGHFEIYNEWLFGKAESALEFTAWNTFHDGDIERFYSWQKHNIFTPAGNEFYNNKALPVLKNVYIQ